MIGIFSFLILRRFAPHACLLLPHFESLYILVPLDYLWQDSDVISDPDAQWLEVLQPFTSVRELHVSETMWPLLAPILKEHTGEMTMNVLPMLCDLFLGGPQLSESFPEAREPFVSARKLAGHPIVVHHREEQG